MDYDLGQKLDLIIEQNNEVIKLLSLVVAKYYPEENKKNKKGVE